jgi:site-specific recombinase XerC
VTCWSPGSVRRYGCSLRSFLRYCYLVGLVDRDLPAAALPVSGRRRSLLPKGITATQAKALLRACDRRRASGRRDYAVIVLILRLGLRAGEVATLRPSTSSKPGSSSSALVTIVTRACDTDMDGLPFRFGPGVRHLDHHGGRPSPPISGGLRCS